MRAALFTASAPRRGGGQPGGVHCHGQRHHDAVIVVAVQRLERGMQRHAGDGHGIAVHLNAGTYFSVPPAWR